MEKDAYPAVTSNLQVVDTSIVMCAGKAQRP